ncbi:dehydrogenase/reductase SDR family member 4-like isoform X1 [Dreissena polymorpha]|uniref:dehydrogenase/reductase SDR family member 4-like isoform X1 n=1 Tax=Dreissena polymorpha TaxID=45954 RepID=UPI002264DE2F|nr:dehydrogenase/reductase SDR family member 4-like isoform X1 [Dreissena polymorpha]
MECLPKRNMQAAATARNRNSGISRVRGRVYLLHPKPRSQSLSTTPFFFSGLIKIGFAIAERLASEGACVMVSSRKHQNVDGAVRELKDKGYYHVSGMVCHVANKEHRSRMIEKTVEEFGGIDFLVSNAAVNPIFGPILDSTEEAWDKIFDVNVKSTFFLVKEVVPYMVKRGGGSIVIVSSQGGYTPSQLMGAYSVSKTALLGLVKALVPQLTQMNIRVNAIAPGVIKTRFSEKLWKGNNEISDNYLNTIPLRRFAEAYECAGAVSFLLSDDASYVTGETVAISGGVSNRL